jgi:hydroxyacylglutathione hydrolase
MLLERSMDNPWLSNTYLVADRPGGTAALIDAGGPVAPLLAEVDKQNLTLTHVLLTHHHHDHVAELGDVLEAHPDVKVVAHPLEAEQMMGVTDTISDGAELQIGDLHVKAIHNPGHTAGMTAFLIDGTDVFSGDTLFKGSVGGVRAPGSTSYADLKSSIMDRYMKLDPSVRVHPGHTDPTTIGDEWENNAFVRVWRGLDPEGDEECTALGEPARLVLFAPDYDGGHKAWVRWPDGRDDIVPGSQVERV